MTAKKKKSSFSLTTRWWNFRQRVRRYWFGETKNIEGRYGNLLIVDRGHWATLKDKSGHSWRSFIKWLRYTIDALTIAGLCWLLQHYLSKHFK